MLNILQICPKPPLPATDGGCKAMYAVAKGLLQAKVDLQILAMNTFKHPFLPGKIPSDFLHQTNMQTVETDIKIKTADAFANLFTRKSYNIQRFINPLFEKKLTELLTQNTYHAIILEGLYVTPYIDTIKKHSTAPIIYREHNIEYLLWQRKAKAEKNRIKKAYLHLLARRLKNYETTILQNIDGIAAITPTDAKLLNRITKNIPITFIPFGIDMLPANSKLTARDPDFSALRLFHIGAMDWFPNYEGMLWFLNDVWPLIHSKFPTVSMHLAGRSMPQDLLHLQLPNVTVYGEVDDAYTFMQQNDIMVSPLFLGSGMRIKIIESMALGKPVITTPIGAEGILYENGKNICIAKSANDFIAHLNALQNPLYYQNMSQAGQELIKSTYGINEISNKLLNFIGSIRQNEK